MAMTAFERFSVRVTQAVGHPWVFLAALAGILAWLALGPACGYSDTWQLWVNTITTVVTFLMVFLIQQAQNRDALKNQLKLDELVAAMKGASNRVIGVDELSERELRGMLCRLETLPPDRRSRSVEDVVEHLGPEDTRHGGSEIDVHALRHDGGWSEGDG